MKSAASRKSGSQSPRRSRYLRRSNSSASTLPIMPSSYILDTCSRENTQLEVLSHSPEYICWNVFIAPPSLCNTRNSTLANNNWSTIRVSCMTPTNYTCTFCSNPFAPKQKPSNPHRAFCSLSCSAKQQTKEGRRWHRPKVIYTCIVCKTEFSGKRPSNKLRPFCSCSCAASYNNKKRARVFEPKSVSQRRTQNITTPCLTCQEPAFNKYCSIKCQHAHKRNMKITVWLNTGVTGCEWKQPQWIRDYIEKEQNGKCDICHNEKMWNGSYLMLILDHISGDASDNHRSNLRLICPNCDSQLPTFKSRNKNSARKYRRDRYAAGKSY